MDQHSDDEHPQWHAPIAWGALAHLLELHDELLEEDPATQTVLELRRQLRRHVGIIARARQYPFTPGETPQSG